MTTTMNDEWDAVAFGLAQRVDVTVTPPSSDPTYIAVENVPHPAPSGLCVNCHARPATVAWVGDGMLAYVHGGGVPWCQHCAVAANLAFARKQAAMIPTLEQQLKQLP
jgi:hypothetical protein